MPEISFKDLQDHIDQSKNSQYAAVYLIYGDAFLNEKSFKALLHAMVPEASRSMNHEPVDPDSNELMTETAQLLTTLSFMPGPKVVSIRESGIFHSKKNSDDILSKAGTAMEKEDIKKAGRLFADYLSVNGVGFEDILDASLKEKLGIEQKDYAWVDKVAMFCIDNNIPVSDNKDAPKLLQDIIEKGYPSNHHLIITTELADKRKSLYKTIMEKGVIINCSVPKGDRKADKQTQQAVLHETMTAMLTKNGKTIDNDAFQYLVAMTGFDLRVFTGNLEKLMAYTGDKKRITGQDARALLKRTKTDPIYELTGAVAERRGQDALAVVRNLLDNSFAHLQILAALINQMRKLMLARDYMDSPFGKQWNTSMTYNQFQQFKMLESIKDYDKSGGEFQEKWNTFISSKKQFETAIAKGAKSPYPLFLLLKNTQKFKRHELNNAYRLLLDADLKLKTSGKDPTLIIEDAIIRICSVL